MRIILIAMLMTFATLAGAHRGGLDKKGCHAGSQPYHCHLTQAPQATTIGQVVFGTITHVRDGDTIEINGMPIRLAALDCPENGTFEGNDATKIAKESAGSEAICELTGDKTYDRFVGYCSIGGVDFGRTMMSKTSCKVWKKFDVWDRY
ncbi:MAG: hypothetical protein QMB16_01695 [Paracoccaceae bacterium]|jgi:endonuclease YncB( thermonuclease family)